MKHIITTRDYTGSVRAVAFEFAGELPDEPLLVTELINALYEPKAHH